MKKTFLMAVAVGLFSAAAYAAILNMSWQNATVNTDGSPIPASGPGSLTNTIVEYGPCNSTRDALTSVTGTITTPATAQTNVTPDLSPGTWCGHAKHTNTYGNVSAWTAVSSKDIPAPTPSAPRNFSFGS